MARDIGVATSATWQTRAEARRAEWLRNGVVSGFVATVAMTAVLAAAYLLVNILGDVDGGPIGRWFAALGDNPVTRRAADAVVLAIGVNLLVGWALALVYARWVEPALGGPGWRKGMIFSLLPWLLSLVVVLPLFGGGMFGVELGAGPLPILGNLILHLVYGGILGGVYATMLDDGLDGSDAEWGDAVATGRRAAAGVIGGVLIGALLGLLAAPLVLPGGGTGVVLAAALLGGAFGLTVGAFAGLGRSSQA